MKEPEFIQEIVFSISCILTSKDIIDTIEDYTEKLARSLHVKGMINIQFIVCDGKVYVIEVNPRSSRTVPYISKVTGIPIVKLATKCIIGHTLKEMGYKPGLQPNADYIAIKMPVFSFEKIRGAETSLGPEMKSTGECLGIAKTFNEALYKAFLGAGVVLPKHKKIIISVKDADKQEVVPLAQRFEKLGYEVYATRSTADVLRKNGVDAIKVNKIHQEAPTVMDLLLEHKIDIVIDTPTQGRDKNRDGFLIRRTSIETGVNCFTSLDTVDALLTSLESDAKNDLSVQVHPNDEYAGKHENSLGKTECWYVLQADEGTKMVMGHHAKTKEEFVKAIENDDYDHLLNSFEIHKGDFFYIPTGTIHAICSGSLIYEAQQSSDITYRVYDYHRKDKDGNERQLHVQQSIDVTSVPSLHSSNTLFTNSHLDNGSKTRYVDSEFFVVDCYRLTGENTILNDKPFQIG